MNTMTRDEIKRDWESIERRHRTEKAQAVARYCVGHSVTEIAEYLGYSRKWVLMQLDFAGAGTALSHATCPRAHPLTGGEGTNVQKELPKMIQQYGPRVTTEMNSGEMEIDGEDADEFQPYYDHYASQGHTPAAAERLARAEWATEAAVEAGVIREGTKNKKRVTQILFPNDSKDTFGLDLIQHMARVKAAARFLEEAKVPYLRRKSTCEKVASANEAWAFQMERMRNFHQTFQEN